MEKQIINEHKMQGKNFDIKCVKCGSNKDIVILTKETESNACVFLKCKCGNLTRIY